MLFSFNTFAQENEEDPPLFGTTRFQTINPALIHNFGEISGISVQNHQFKIKNTGKTDLLITDVKLPEQVGVTIQTKTIKPGSEGLIIVSVDPTIIVDKKFKKKIIIYTKQTESGVITKKEITYSVSGNVE